MTVADVALTGARRKIRMGRVRDALVFPFKNVVALLRMGILPLLLALVLGSVVVVIARAAGGSLDVQGQRAIGRIVFIFVLGLYAVGIHRLIVRGEAPGRVRLRFGRYEQAYWGVLGLFAIAFAIEGFVLGLLLSLVGAVAQPGGITDTGNGIDGGLEALGGMSFAGFAVSVAFTVLIIWLHARLALMFPHAAVTGRISPSVSWRAMAGNVWRMVGAGLLIVLAMVPVYALIALPAIATRLLGLSGDEGAMALVQFAIIPGALIAFCLVTTVFGAFMSYIYMDLVDEAPSQARKQ